MKRKLIFALGVLLVFSFVSINCNAQSSALVGKWIWEDEEAVFEFFRDGTLIISTDDDWKTKYSWEITKNGRLTLKWIGEEYEPDFQGTGNFKISGSVLTIYFEEFEGEAATFKKVMQK